jgi:dolichyl-phosphate-mannose-protein mannosyltransferase
MKQFSGQSVQFKVLVVLIFAASCLRIFVCFRHNPMDYLFSDMLRHWLNGQHFPRGGYTGAGDPIVYQAYISVLQRLTANNRYLIALASALMSILMPWTFYRAARDFGLRKIPAMWVWALIAWTPSLLAIYHYIMMETLLLLLEGVALWMTARYLRKGGTTAFLVFVFSWTLASLTKPTVIPMAGICFLWVWWKKSTALRDIGMGAALALVMLVPQAVRSKIELGFVAPFGNPWLTRIMLRSGARMTYFHVYAPSDEQAHFNLSKDKLMEFGSPSCFIRPLEPVSHWAIRRAFEDSKARVIIDSSHGERDWKNAYEQFNNDTDTEEWMAQWRENIILFFFAPSWPETSVGQWDGHLEYLGRWLWAPLILVVLVFNTREFTHRRFDLIPVAVTVFTLLLALQNTVLVEGRYRKPLEPLLVLNLVWVLAGKQKATGEPGLQGE